MGPSRCPLRAPGRRHYCLRTNIGSKLTGGLSPPKVFVRLHLSYLGASPYLHRAERRHFIPNHINSKFSSQFNGAATTGFVRGAYHIAFPGMSSGTNHFINKGRNWTNNGVTLPGDLSKTVRASTLQNPPRRIPHTFSTVMDCAIPDIDVFSWVHDSPDTHPLGELPCSTSQKTHVVV